MSINPKMRDVDKDSENFAQELGCEASLVTEAETQYEKQAASQNSKLAYQSDINLFERRGGSLPSSEVELIEYFTDWAKKLNPN